MSYTTIIRSTRDAELTDRIYAAVSKEAWASETLSATEFGQAVQTNPAEASRLVWPVCIDYEAQYAYAVDTGNEHPGGSTAVISDANIQAAVQVHWPADA